MRKPTLLVALMLSAVAYIHLGGSGGCGGGTTPNAASSSGAFGVVTVNGKQKLYLPLLGTTSLGDGQIAVVDVGVTGAGVTGAPALVTNIDLGSTDLATCTGGTDQVVIAASTQSYNVWFIDPSTDKVTSTLQLDPNLGNSSFSGGGGIVTGIAMDPTHNQAILSIWDGFAYVDLATKTVTSYTAAAPSENFGFDSVRELILAPFYDCSAAYGDAGQPPAFCNSYMAGDAGVMLAGLNVIRLLGDAGVVYTYENLSAPDPLNPLGQEPDSASIDTSTGLAVVPDEGSGTQYIIDLSKAAWNDQTLTFTAPTQSSLMIFDTGVAVESATHLAFWEAEHTSGVAVADLSAAYGSSSPTAVMADMPTPPAGSSWSNLGDPHGVAVTTGIQSGSPVGFVVNEDSSGVWVGRIDLQKMLSLGSNADISTAVTFLDATTKEK